MLEKMAAADKAKTRRRVRKAFLNAAHVMQDKDAARVAGSLLGARQFRKRMKKAYKTMPRG
jgi:hypothetical protein